MGHKMFFECVSIPQRSDLNHCYDQVKDWRKQVSIPQRSDLNRTSVDCDVPLQRFQSRNGLIWTNQKKNDTKHYLSFNPATVWFELRSRASAALFIRVSIPQRSDLNQDATAMVNQPIISFNPATVWFEQLTNKVVDTLFDSFNPATVWFEPFFV